MAGKPGTPTKGRRFGGSASHQKAMFANLTASLILAEGAPAETFIDNAARENFDNWEEHAALDDGVLVSELVLPRATSARQVPAATQRRLAALAVELAGLVPVAA